MSDLFALRQVAAGYGSKTVVRDITLEIQPGEFCALLGLNGSGKTTLLKAICGLLSIREGHCLVDGLDCTHLSEHKRARHISYIPQRYSKMQGVIVSDVVLMGRNPHLGVLESPSRQDRVIAETMLERMGIADLAEKDFSRLSEGQKQLVILARTLVQDSSVMLMDEPDSALDFLNRHRMLGRIQELIHNEHKAGLVTLHDPNFALAYCDRLILLHNGSIAAQLPLKGASAQEIQDCLYIIYGKIAVLEHNRQYMMIVK